MLRVRCMCFGVLACRNSLFPSSLVYLYFTSTSTYVVNFESIHFLRDTNPYGTRRTQRVDYTADSKNYKMQQLVPQVAKRKALPLFLSRAERYVTSFQTRVAFALSCPCPTFGRRVSENESAAKPQTGPCGRVRPKAPFAPKSFATRLVNGEFKSRVEKVGVILSNTKNA